MKTVAIYARVSTTDKGRTRRMQLVRAARIRGRSELKIVGEYVDNESGYEGDSRPELNRFGAMLAAQIRCCSVWRS